MDITSNTTVGEAAPFLQPEHIEQLMQSERIEPAELEKSLFDMSVGEFLECLSDGYTATFFKNPEEPLVKAVGRLKTFKTELDNVNKILSLNEIKPENEEKAAQKGVVFPSFGESVLCDCVDWFNLHSFDEAENLPLTNYLIMKRRKSAEALYERNLNKIYSKKAETKKKK